jgi:diguanylate cyclase (GGDEF)-like protein
MITGLGDEGVAVQAMREGAYDYLSKTSLQPARVQAVIEGSLRWAEMEAELGQARDRLHQLSLYDTLTGLPNRNLFFDRLEQALSVAKRTRSGLALLMMDLDGFKAVNDTLGHAAGDQLLAEVGRRMEETARRSDTYARIGGDEFAAVLVGCDSLAGTVTIAERLRAAVSEPFIFDGELFRIGLSVGVALSPDHGSDARTLLAHADGAMYLAKRGNRGYAISGGLGGAEARAFLIASHLPEAVERNEVFLDYQPRVDLRSGTLAGVEALARWRNPRLGLVPPGEFIPCAERSVLIRPLTYTILEMALDQVVAWRALGWEMPMAVNLSARMFDDPMLTDSVFAALAARDIHPSQLTLEITETALMTNVVRTRETLAVLRGAGVRISIDDYGAGYTSLKYLREFDICEIKIDKLFITSLQPGSRDASIVSSLSVLTRGFSIDLVAEGVEDAASCPLLLDLGCDLVQGFGVARPMAPSAMPGWVAQRASG